MTVSIVISIMEYQSVLSLRVFCLYIMFCKCVFYLIFNVLQAIETKTYEIEIVQIRPQHCLWSGNYRACESYFITGSTMHL